MYSGSTAARRTRAHRPGQVRAPNTGRDISFDGGDNVADQPLIARHVFPDDHGRLGHARAWWPARPPPRRARPGTRGSSPGHRPARRIPPALPSGVHFARSPVRYIQLALPPRTGEGGEPLGGLPRRPAPITPRQGRVERIQFPGATPTGVSRVQIGHPAPTPGYWRPGGRSPPRRGPGLALPRGHVHRGLGRPVQSYATAPRADAGTGPRTQRRRKEPRRRRHTARSPPTTTPP